MRSRPAFYCPLQLYRHTLSQQHLRSYCFFSDAQSQTKSKTSGLKSENGLHAGLGKCGVLPPHVSISFVLETIVNRARRDGSPSSVYTDTSDGVDPSLWKTVFEKKLAFEPKPDTSFGEWLNYVDMVSPTTKANNLALVVKKVIQMLDTNHDAQLDWINIKLSFANVIHVLTSLKKPTAAFAFYKWVRERSYYVPDKSVCAALVDRLIAFNDEDAFSQVHFVMSDMIEGKLAVDSKQFGRLLALIETAKPINRSRMQLYVEWLLKMRPLGLVPWFCTYERAMKICNKLEMYDSTISIFKAIPENSYSWAFTLALSACKFTGNVDVAEELFKEMKVRNLDQDAKCCNDLLIIYASLGHAEKARNLLEEMKSCGVPVNLETKFAFEPKLGTLFHELLNDVEMTSPTAKAFVVEKIVQILDENHDAQLDWINIEFSCVDVVYVLNNVKYPTAAFAFYKWVRERSRYVPDKSVYMVLIDRLIASSKVDAWDEVHLVMMDMIERQTAPDSKQFGRLLALVEAAKETSTSRMHLYVEWLLKMTPLGLKPFFSTYEKAMKKCNKLEMYDFTISIFRCIPENTHSWAFTLAFSACKCTSNVDVAEELFREMKVRNMSLDAKCCNELLTIYASLALADKAKDLLEEMKNSGVLIDLRHNTSVIHAFAKVGRVKEAEDVFRSIEQKFDAGIYRAMAACYRNAGLFNELLALLRQADGSMIGATCFALAFEACVEKSEWKIALEIIKDMHKWGMTPSPRLYRSILLACAKVNDYTLCKALDFNLREMDALSLEDVERFVKLYVSLEKVPQVLDALEVLNEQGFGPPTADLFEYCIFSFLETNLTDAIKMYNIMRSVGYVPSSRLFMKMIEKHVPVEDMPQSKNLHDDKVTAGFELEELIASLVLPSCKIE